MNSGTSGKTHNKATPEGAPPVRAFEKAARAGKKVRLVRPAAAGKVPG